jgi:hypothetical protein
MEPPGNFSEPPRSERLNRLARNNSEPPGEKLGASGNYQKNKERQQGVEAICGRDRFCFG